MMLRISSPLAGCVLAAGSLSVVAACAAQGAKSGNSGSQLDPGELEQQFTREAEPIQKHPVRGGNAWQAYLEAKSEPVVEKHDGYMTVTADLGWDSEVSCFVYDSSIDAGSAAHLLLEEAAKSVEFKKVAPYYLEPIGLEPALSIRGLYQVEQDGVAAAGDYKLMVVPRTEFPVLCMHDAPGYAQSFARITTDFAKSFEFESEMPAPMRAEVWRVMLDGVPVGFSKRSAYELKDGNLRFVSVSAQFLPTSPGELAIEDDVSVINSDQQGKLLDGKYVSYENGEPSLEMDVEKTKKGYNYAGTIQNKEVSGSFKAKKPVVVQYALERRLKQIAEKKEKSQFDLWEYLPSLDPSDASKVSYEVTPEQGGMAVQASMGKRSTVSLTNSRGVVQQHLMQVGSRKIEIQLLEETGEL